MFLKLFNCTSFLKYEQFYYHTTVTYNNMANAGLHVIFLTHVYMCTTCFSYENNWFWKWQRCHIGSKPVHTFTGRIHFSQYLLQYMSETFYYINLVCGKTIHKSCMKHRLCNTYGWVPYKYMSSWITNSINIRCSHNRSKLTRPANVVHRWCCSQCARGTIHKSCCPDSQTHTWTRPLQACLAPLKLQTPWITSLERFTVKPKLKSLHSSL